MHHLHTFSETLPFELIEQLRDLWRVAFGVERNRVDEPASPQRDLEVVAHFRGGQQWIDRRCAEGIELCGGGLTLRVVCGAERFDERVDLGGGGLAGCADRRRCDTHARGQDANECQTA